MTNLFELRLCNLGILIERRGVELCTKILSSGDTKAIKELLLPVNGIEPKVIATFFFLREIRTSSAGSELFIVDNSDVDWKVVRYLRDWCQISKAIDCATGNFEIGALLRWMASGRRSTSSES